MLSKEIASALVAARLVRGHSRRDVEEATGVALGPVEDRRSYLSPLNFIKLWHYLTSDPPPHSSEDRRA